MGYKHLNFGRFSYVILCCFVLLNTACKKSSSVTESKFKIQPLNYQGLFYLNTIKLSNGDYVTIDQDIILSHMNIGLYDSNSNLIVLKKYQFNSTLYLTNSMAYQAGFVVAGYTTDYSSFVVTRLDANADAIWDSTYTPGNNNTGLQAVVCCTSPDGNILAIASPGPPGLGGTTAPAGSPIIEKINGASGALLDTQINIGAVNFDSMNCIATSVYEINDGVYVSGYYFYLYSGGWTFGSSFCLKSQESGNTQWISYEPQPPANKYLTGNPYINGYNIAPTNSGPIVLVTTNASQFAISSIEDLYIYWYLMIGYTTVFSYDPATGNKLDSVTFSINNKSELPIIQPTKDGGYIIAATGNIYLNSFTAPTVILLIKTDAQFNIQWQQTYNPDGSEFIVFGVFPLGNGYQIIGQSNKIVNNKSIVGTFLMKTDMQGNLKD